MLVTLVLVWVATGSANSGFFQAVSAAQAEMLTQMSRVAPKLTLESPQHLSSLSLNCFSFCFAHAQLFFQVTGSAWKLVLRELL